MLEKNSGNIAMDKEENSIKVDRSILRNKVERAIDFGSKKFTLSDYNVVF